MISRTEFKTLLAPLKSSSVELVAVSKRHSALSIEKLYTYGQRHFGENLVQELVEKVNLLPKDILWHMIGHLQRNKVKDIIGHVYLIHSVDSIRLLERINSVSKTKKCTTNVLLQYKVALEDSKYGLTKLEIDQILKRIEEGEFKNVEFKGMMTMATNTPDLKQRKSEFKEVNDIFNSIRDLKMDRLDDFNLLSMGMSNDYKGAIEAGSNLVRIGSAIFGAR